MNTWSLAVVVMMGIVGCGNRDLAMQVATRVDSSGIEIVSNPAEDRRLAWEFERVLTLGGADGGPESFYRVPPHGLAFDPQGRIYVLDAGNRRVQVFDGTGRFLRTSGREGEGPGEFQYPASFAVDSSGTLTVHDFGHRALMRFDASGAFVDQQPAPQGMFGPVRAEGNVHLFATRRRAPDVGGMIFRLQRAVPGDTAELLRVRLAEPKSIHYESCGVAISLAPLFASPPRWDSRGGRLALAGGAVYSVRIFENGVEVRRVRRALEPEVARREHAERELGEGEAWVIGGRDCTVPPEEVIEKRGIAEAVPLIGRVAVAPDGGVWVQREVIGSEAGPVDVFDATGEYMGTLPAETPWPVDFGPGKRILVLEEDELGVQRVGVYRIRRN